MYTDATADGTSVVNLDGFVSLWLQLQHNLVETFNSAPLIWQSCEDTDVELIWRTPILLNVTMSTYKIRYEETHYALVKGIKDCDPEHERKRDLQEKDLYHISHEHT